MYPIRLLRKLHVCGLRISVSLFLAAFLTPSAKGQTNLALNKPATQSSTYSAEYAAGVCVDGNRATGLCHTNSEANPWWQVDLGGDYAVSQIVVYNRTGTWGSREHTLRALLSTDGRSWSTIYTHNGSDFEVLPISAGNRTARYVRLQLAATEYLNLQEVEVFGAGAPPSNPPPPPSSQGQTNLALNKPATQSSTYSSDYAAGVCVDGNRTSGLCHTNSEASPWWQVDLGGNYALSQIVVYNRAGTWGSREHTLRALLSTDGRSWSTIYTHNGSDFEVLPISAGNRTARYVRLQLAATEYLNLQEVEVYGAGASEPNPPPPPSPQGQTNLALNKPATQSSTYSAEYAAGVCVDGNRTAGLCHTNSEANPWWQVDLGGNYALSQIVVYNRTGPWGARERTIRALLSTDGRSWSTIYTHNGSDFEVVTINAGNQTARYVRLQLAATEYLNLQEVEVYGAGAP